MADDFSRYDKVRKFQDFPPLPPHNPNRPGAGENPLDDRGVKDLIEVINAMGPDFPPEATAKYLRELCVEYPTNADVYEASARHEDMRALKRELALQAEEKIVKKQEAGEALRQERHRRFMEWCEKEGITLPGEPQGRQPDNGQRQDAQPAQGAQSQDAQPIQDAHCQGGQLQGGQGQDGQGQGCQPDPIQGCQGQGCQPDSGQGGQAQDGQGSIHLHACEWLSSALINGPCLQSELMTRAQAAGMSERSLRRAKVALGVKSFKQGKHWYWRLPAVSDVMPPGADPPGEADLSPSPPSSTDCAPEPDLSSDTPTVKNGRYIYPL